MESFNFELKLVSDIDKVSKRGADALKGVQSQATKTQKTLNWGDALGKQFEKVGFKAALAAKKQHDAFAASWVKIGMQAEKSARQQQKAFERAAEKQRRFAEKAKEHSLLGGIKEGLGFKRIASASFVGTTLAEGMIEGAHKAVEVVTEGVKKAFEAVSKEQQLRAGYRLTLGAVGGTEAREDAERVSKLTAFSASQTQEQMLPLYNAGMKGRGARSAYALALDLAAASGKGADQGAVTERVQALANIQMRGGISTRQLTTLGLANASVPKFGRMLGRELHVSSDEALKRAEKPGGVDPQIILNTLARAMEAQQGGKLGTGAVTAGKSLAGQFNKLTELPEEYLRKFAESPAMDKMAGSLSRVLERLDPNSDNGKKIFAALETSFDKLMKSAERALTPANIDRFANSVSSVLGGLEKLPSILDKVVTASEAIAVIWGGSKIIGGVTSLATMLPGIATAAGTATGAIGAMAAPLGAVALAAGSVGVALARIQNTAQELGGWDRVSKDFKDWLSDEKPAEATGLGAPKGMHWDASINGYRPNVPFHVPVAAAPNSSAASGKQTVNMQNHVTINVHAAPGEDPDKSHREAAANVHKHITRAIEQAAQEGGG